jgi:glyceraldehyde-3-phosphate dehydrogenase/erythrose-4-phosphate dehydrogenase
MDKKIVHVVGTGTIGEPLTGLLLHMKESLGIDEVTFEKKTARLDDRSKVRQLIALGGKLAAYREASDSFCSLGIEPSLTVQEALEQASVVIDCTPVGNEKKENLYRNYPNVKGFIAQGSEFGFGKPYARGINDDTLSPGEDRFIQVVSCNTHNISVILKTLAMYNGEKMDNLAEGRFLCIRRANDISQDGSFIASPQAGGHEDSTFGTHHARDAWHLFKTLDMDVNIFSSAIKVNTQYMHTLWFHMKVKEPISVETLVQHIDANRRVAVTYKKSANSVFSFGRDHGHFGRILSQAVVPVRSLHVKDEHEVTGFCYTPQDGNSILSSAAATIWFLYPDELDKRLEGLREFMFQEV